MDQALDARQAYVYWSFAYDHNSDFNIWAQSKCVSTPDDCETVSKLYFFFSMVTWFSAPLLAAVFYGYLGGNNKLGFFGEQDEAFLKFTVLKSVGKYVDNLPSCLRVPLMLFVFPLANYVIATVFVYVVIPLALFKVGVITLWYGPDNIDGGKELLGTHFYGFTSCFMSAHKLWENFGEAIPQMAIAITFLANNYTFVDDFSSVVLMILSIAFSFTSISIGIYTGCLAGCDLIMNWFNIE